MFRTIIVVATLLLVPVTGKAQTATEYLADKNLTPEIVKSGVLKHVKTPDNIYKAAVHHEIYAWVLADLFATSSGEIFNFFNVSATDEKKLEDNNSLLNIDFESFPLGDYSKEMLFAAFTKELPERMSIVTFNLFGKARVVLDDKGSHVLEIIHLANQGDSQNALQVYFKFIDQSELMFSYRLKFAADFDHKKGGKLPGLGGVPHIDKFPNPTSGRYVGPDDGFSLRSMYKPGGRAVIYAYYQDNANYPSLLTEENKKEKHYGEDISLYAGTTQYYLPTVSWLEISQYVRINRDNTNDGELHYKIDGRSRLKVQNKIWSASRSYGINRLFLDFFHGGKGSDWNPNNDSSLFIDDIKLSRPKATFFK